ncbi:MULTISPECIES: hypothetical protein [unclassified Mycobacterium]|uniref:hypothetical protein n=1 Tax=unclassified Mycobacterium TaxID=2642494 RepID=UPI0008974E1A|nr:MULTISPECIES: hypothetical protein [unclassified Mycobacterium]SEA59564.1 hypothetical protein SAMN04488580_103394 [Mycobacterium sp. 283mftsu]
MSLVAMASVAVARDLAPVGQPLNSVTIGAGQGVSPSPAPSGGVPDAQPEMPAPGPTATLRRPTDIAQVTPPAPLIDTAAGFAQLLAAQIPAEALVAYTTLLALFVDSGPTYNTGRWVLYGFSVIACGAIILATYCAKRNYTLQHGDGVSALCVMRPPYLPIAAAMLSMAVYGLTVPGSPLQYSVPDGAFTMLSGTLAVGGALMMTILTPFLGTGNAAVPVANSEP